jgi:hypothetical protein
MFRKYTHVERWGNSEVQGIEVGECYIFPKLDGTNASVWYDNKNKQICSGSRTRKLSIEDDNAGFHKWALEDEKLNAFFKEYPGFRLYGEWLVPHSLKTYREDAWRKFYVFDVTFIETQDEAGYLHYDYYSKALKEFDLDFIAPMKRIINPTYEMLLVELENNKFLIEEGKGSGEGITIKNYDYENQWGRLCFAKLVTNEFKDKHSKEMGAPKVINKMVEDEIVQTYVTKALCDKVHAKIVNEMEGWRSQYIPRLLQTVYYDLINEEIWNIVKKMKQPTINFRTLNTCVIMEIKRLLPELF